MTVIQFAPGLRPVLKHLKGQHDQQTHARGGSSLPDGWSQSNNGLQRVLLGPNNTSITIDLTYGEPDEASLDLAVRTVNDLQNTFPVRDLKLVVSDKPFEEYEQANLIDKDALGFVMPTSELQNTIHLRPAMLSQAGMEPMKVRSDDPNFFMASANDTPSIQYIVTHEYGHVRDRRGSRINSDAYELYRKGIVDISKYGSSNEAERWAESFTEYVLTNGKTTNATVQYFADKYFWAEGLTKSVAEFEQSANVLIVDTFSDKKPPFIVETVLKHGDHNQLMPVLKHPGHSNQKVHGRRGASAEHIAETAETGEHLGVGVPVPEELQGAFDYATGQSRPFNGDEKERLEFLREKAHEWANKNGFPDDDYPYSDMTSAQIYAAAVVRRAMDKKAQDERWSETSDADAQKVKEVFDDWRDEGEVMVRVPSEHLDDILADRVLTQFDTGESRGLLNHDLRAITETAAFDIHPAVDASHRPVYGFIGKEGSESTPALGQYGDVTLVLKDSVRERTTVTLGDSLNTTATPVPLLGAVTARQVSDASAVTFFGDVPRHVARSGSAPLDEGAMYMEAQIHVGGVRKADISRIIFSGRDDLDLDVVSDLADSLVADGIEVDIDYSNY